MDLGRRFTINKRYVPRTQGAGFSRTKVRNVDNHNLNPFRAVGKYIYHFSFVKFLGLEGKINPKYFLT